MNTHLYNIIKNTIWKGKWFTVAIITIFKNNLPKMCMDFMYETKFI